MARSRWRPPSRIASSIGCPSSRKRWMASSLTTASLSAMPIITMMPISETALSDWPVSQRQDDAAGAARAAPWSGSPAAMVNDANSPASTRNISATERMRDQSELAAWSAAAPVSAPVTATVHRPGGVSFERRGNRAHGVAREVPPCSTTASTTLTGRWLTRTTSIGARSLLHVHQLRRAECPAPSRQAPSARFSLALPA